MTDNDLGYLKKACTSYMGGKFALAPLLFQVYFICVQINSIIVTSINILLLTKTLYFM